MINHIKNRDILVRSLRAELVGPSPTGTELDCNSEIVFNDYKEGYQPYIQKDSKEEIIQRDSPSKRYGIGVLYPHGIGNEQELIEPGFIGRDASINNDKDKQEDIVTAIADKDLDEVKNKASRGSVERESDDLDLSMANSYKPSSMAISFLAELLPNSRLIVIASGGRYTRKKVKIQDREHIWWLRSPVSIKVELIQKNLCSSSFFRIPVDKKESENIDNLDLEIEVFSRPYKKENTRLLTVCLVNRSISTSVDDEKCLFQTGFEATIISPDKLSHIMPYPRPSLNQLDVEEQGLNLLYRNTEMFAVGHGCSADWEVTLENKGKAKSVIAESLPIVETPSITPDILKEDGNPLEISMAKLAGIVNGDDGFESLSELIQNYASWITKRQDEISSLENDLQVAAENNLNSCQRLAVSELLNASHIVPWAVDSKNRLNPRNGLCLNSLHDRAFDRGLLTITTDYRVMVSKKLKVLSDDESWV